MNDDIKTTYLNQINAVISNQEKSQLLLRALSDIHDTDWLENFYIQYAQSDDIDIAKLALTCIAHLVRVRQSLNVDKIMVFLQALQISNPTLTGNIQDVLEDIAIFTHATKS